MAQLRYLDPSPFDVFVGIDVDKKSYAVTFKNKQTQEYRSLKMPSNPSSLMSYFEKRCPNARIAYAYEAGPTGYGLHDRLKEHGQECIMVHPGNIEKAPKDRVKTNRLDSRRITMLAQSGRLPGIHVPEDAYRQLRHLCSSRQQYAGDQRRAKQRIESFLLFEGINLLSLEGSRWSAHHIKILKELKLDSVRRFKLDSLLSDLNYAREKLLICHKRLREFYRENPVIRRHIELLRTIPGFGFVVSAYFLSRIGDPKNLGSVRQIGSFAGVVPQERSTGETIHKGGITHMGDPILRSLLVEAGWAAIRKDTELGRFYHRIKSKNKGEKGPRIAIVAVARKLTQRAHRVLKDQSPYIVH